MDQTLWMGCESAWSDAGVPVAEILVVLSESQKFMLVRCTCETTGEGMRFPLCWHCCNRKARDGMSEMARQLEVHCVHMGSRFFPTV